MTSISTSKQTLDIIRKDYGKFKIASDYTIIGTGHHAKFNTVDTNNIGDGITLDISTGYVTTPNVASLGRWTLKAGRKHSLKASLTIAA